MRYNTKQLSAGQEDIIEAEIISERDIDEREPIQIPGGSLLYSQDEENSFITIGRWILSLIFLGVLLTLLLKGFFWALSQPWIIN